MRNLTLTTWICLAGLAFVLATAVFGEEIGSAIFESRDASDEQEYVQGADLTRLSLPPGPGRDLVAQYCQTCHHLSRVEKAGGSIDDWTSRIDRMIRNGAILPRDRIPEVAAYLAGALPQRPRDAFH